MNSKAKYYPTAFVLYLNYFVQGIATGVLGQQIMKEALVTQWGGDIVKDIGLVATVVAAAGLGRLIILPFAGPLSDKLGRKIFVIRSFHVYDRKITNHDGCIHRKSYFRIRKLIFRLWCYSMLC